ncbi:hypothetical protein [Vibrio ziniensis]|uniref:Uncharacterized protein n=1 Tax=Vibrio ziniensis TaxID=2711221 RepID=A0A6G7CH41_9VIBR|nr:hypothetical protein [Vibrio ziniensis]QIH41422.1 hypothetical protein G5S32_05170 [Vibrio ziniensis]
MNKSIIVGALIIGASVIASPFIYNSLKQAQLQKEQLIIAEGKEHADTNALEHYAQEYKKIKGHCPSKASEMVTVVIRKEPKDRYGIEYETKGDCKFHSLEGITSESY